MSTQIHAKPRARVLPRPPCFACLTEPQAFTVTGGRHMVRCRTCSACTSSYAKAADAWRAWRCIEHNQRRDALSVHRGYIRHLEWQLVNAPGKSTSKVLSVFWEDDRRDAHSVNLSMVFTYPGGDPENGPADWQLLRGVSDADDELVEIVERARWRLEQDGWA